MKNFILKLHFYRGCGFSLMASVLCELGSAEEIFIGNNSEKRVDD